MEEVKETLSSKILLKSKKNNFKCRGQQFHHRIQSPKYELEFCSKCDAYVEFRKVCNDCLDVPNECTHGPICYCCGKKTQKMFKKVWLSRILQAGWRQHHNFIRDWCIFPTRERIWVEIKYGGTVYEIQIKYLALYNEQINEDDKMRIIEPKLSYKGFRITFPEEEQMDELCYICGKKLFYDLNGKIFCKSCNGKH